MSRAYKPWRLSELEHARQLREEGLSWREVGERIGRTEHSMEGLMAMLRREDEVEAAPARTTQVIPRYTYKYWRPSELRLAREMRASGSTWAEIGEKLGRRPKAVWDYVARMDREAVMVEVIGRRNARYAALTEHERAIVDAKLNDGLGVRAVAEHVGRHWYVISTYKRTRGHPRPELGAQGLAGSGPAR